MPSFFQKVLADAKGLEEEVLGPDYKYTDFIKSPDELGMSDRGNISTLTKDVEGIIAYVEVLASGQSKASKTGQALGDQFFLETGAKCKDIATGKKVTRSLYINNIPDGSLPFISSGMGVDFKDFKGLVPGVIENISNLNPMLIFQAFMSGSEPDCQSVTMPTMDVNNNSGIKTAYVTNTDIQDMNACWFSNGVNPVRYAKDPNDKGARCKEEGFQNYSSKMPNDPYVKLYYSLIAILGLYILLKTFKRKLF